MSDDLIGRQAAIAYAISGLTREIDGEKWIRVSEVRESIKEMPPEHPELQWTPVSEGPPKAYGRYFVTRGLNACGSIWNRTYIANYSDLMGTKNEAIWWQGNVGKSDFERLDDVLAWMSCPRPYKEENDVKLH